MKQTIIYVGLDVDDIQYHGSAVNKDTGEVLGFKHRPTLKGMPAQLNKIANIPCLSCRDCPALGSKNLRQGGYT